MDTETEKNLSTGKLRATDWSAFPECGHRTEVSGRKRKAGGALPRSPRAHSRFQSPTARKGVAGFPPLKERGAVEISHLSEARRERQVCSLRSLKCVSPWSGSRSGSSRPDSRGVGPGAALGRDDGWGLSLLLLTGARVNPNIQGPSALKAETPRNGRFAGSAGKRRTRLGPPKPSSRRGICSFPPGPSAEALRPPPPAPPHRVQGAPPQAHALPPKAAARWEGRIPRPPTPGKTGGRGRSGRGEASAPSSRAPGAGPSSGSRGSGESCESGAH